MDRPILSVRGTTEPPPVSRSRQMASDYFPRSKETAMQRFKIKTTLSGIFAAIGLTVATFSAYSIDHLKGVNDKVGDVVTVWMPALEMVKDIEVRLGDIRTGYRTHILQRDRAGKDAALKLIDDSVQKLDADSAMFASLSSSDAQRRLLSSIRENFADYMERGKAVLLLSDAGKLDEAIAVLKQVMMQRAAALKAASVELTQATKTASKEAYARAQVDFSATFTLTILATIGLLAMILGALWFIWSNVAGPIERITSAMRGLASGDAASPIPFAGRADEIGDMAAAVEVFRTNAQENARLEAEAGASRARDERDRERHAIEQAERAVVMEKATGSLGEGLRHLAEGDLHFRLTAAFAPDFERLRADFNAAAETLRDTLSDVAQTTGAIDGGSVEISGSVDDRTRRNGCRPRPDHGQCRPVGAAGRGGAQGSPARELQHRPERLDRRRGDGGDEQDREILRADRRHYRRHRRDCLPDQSARPQCGRRGGPRR